MLLLMKTYLKSIFLSKRGNTWLLCLFLIIRWDNKLLNYGVPLNELLLYTLLWTITMVIMSLIEFKKIGVDVKYGND